MWLGSLLLHYLHLWLLLHLLRLSLHLLLLNMLHGHELRRRGGGGHGGRVVAFAYLRPAVGVRCSRSH